MTFAAVVLLFPLVLTIHNMDEYSQQSAFTEAYHSHVPARFRTKRVLGWAAALLSAAAAVLSLLTYAYANAPLRWLLEVSIFALFWNAIGHCALSAIRHTIVPGTRSACVLVLPYSIVAISVLHAGLAIPVRALLGYAVAGAIAVPLTALTFLAMGYGVSRLTARAADEH